MLQPLSLCYLLFINIHCIGPLIRPFAKRSTHENWSIYTCTLSIQRQKVSLSLPVDFRRNWTEPRLGPRLTEERIDERIDHLRLLESRLQWCQIKWRWTTEDKSIFLPGKIDQSPSDSIVWALPIEQRSHRIQLCNFIVSVMGLWVVEYKDV